jgi:hypothetical protein
MPVADIPGPDLDTKAPKRRAPAGSCDCHLHIFGDGIDPDEHLVQVPATLLKRPMMKASFPDLVREHRTETVPPEPHCLVGVVRAKF